MIIGITGKSGVGKTTLTSYLNKKIENSIAISIDSIDIQVLMSHRDKLIELFGLEIIKNNRINFNLFFEKKEKVDKMHDITKSEFIELVINKIDIAARNHQFIIIDWFLLPNYEELWNICDYHILVESKNEKEMWNKLIIRDTERQLDTGKNIKKTYDILDKHYPKFEAFKYDEIFENYFDETLETKADEFIERLKKIKNR